MTKSNRLAGTMFAVLTFALAANVGADETTIQDWSTQTQCREELTSDGERRCWSTAKVWWTEGEETHYVADFQYACGDRGYEALFVMTTTRKGWASSEKAFDLPVRWDDGDATSIPVHTFVEKTSSFNVRTYYYLIDREHAQDTLKAMAAHEEIHIEIPARKKHEPFWATASLRGAISGIASALETCGITESKAGPLPAQ